MILLDTNHVSILRMPPSERRTRLVERMTLSHDEHFGIPIVAVEETMRGWLAAIAKERLAQRQVPAYRELGSLFEFFATFRSHLLIKRPPICSTHFKRPRFELPRVI